jgi:hypothetical protein
MRPADAKFRLRSFESVNTAPLIAINPSECCAATNSSDRTFGPKSFQAACPYRKLDLDKKGEAK